MGTRVAYRDQNEKLEGYLAAPVHAHGFPGVLVVPSWLNVNDSICHRADRLAELGYAAFVVDLLGVGVRPGPPQSPLEVVGPFLKDRMRFRRRLFAALDAFQHRPECGQDRVAAIGYCIGGCGVLELARAGAPLRGVVSLHGILTAPIPAEAKPILPKILVFQGDADPLVSFEQLALFRDEMRSAEANWELDIYGSARHSFTGEGVVDHPSPEAGLHPQSEARSWRVMLEFLAEVLDARHPHES
ncbi:MAG: dienelactone hydrolase family protein [Candidatus Acidiferrum sp.]|jgi:dienelactone hydrolase